MSPSNSKEQSKGTSTPKLSHKGTSNADPTNSQNIKEDAQSLNQLSSVRADQATLPSLKTMATVQELPGKIATFKAAAVVDAHPPLFQLQRLMQDSQSVKPGDLVVYWMRMQDMRIEDNRALSLASEFAIKHGIPLVVLFVIIPGDYRAHDRSPRRIDFMLRNLRIIKSSLNSLNIPIHVITQTPRTTIPQAIVDLLKSWNASHIYANAEYEVDELRRDIRVLEICARDGSIQAVFIADKSVVEPGVLATTDGKPHTVYSPFFRSWVEYASEHPEVLQQFEPPRPNGESVRQHQALGQLFHERQIPDQIIGFKCQDRKKMEELWPAGTQAAAQIFDRFLHTEPRTSQVGDASPLSDGAKSPSGKGRTRMQQYKDNRARCDIDGSSRMSPYLASGVISARSLIHLAMKYENITQIDTKKKTPVGSFISEIAWRDFYIHVLAAFPRVSMGRPFLEQFKDVQWETDPDVFEKWKRGLTGVPIVDASMRQCTTQGWMHNRARMIAAMYLTKDLMMDWRLGEQFFMQQFIDGDLASNNGGWQWSASTGNDPQSYSRIFNPYIQAAKADPTGEYIRHFVPELKGLSGKALHDPSKHLSAEEFKKLGYPKPLIDHFKAKDRALARYEEAEKKADLHK